MTGTDIGASEVTRENWDSSEWVRAHEALSRLASDEGRASYQIALSVCPECSRGHQLASGELVPVDANVVAMAECDGQCLGPTAAPVAIDRPTANERPVSNETPVVKEGAHMSARAKQTVTPATRRAVLCRDHRRCLVPGCRNARFLDVHHVETRAEGGRNEADNLITLCSVHHRAAHRGELVITRSVSAGVRFRHADGSDYGQALAPRVADTQAKAFAALRGLGFRETEVRRDWLIRPSEAIETQTSRASFEMP